MKKLKQNLSSLIVLLFVMHFSIVAFAQAPNFMSYQAVVRNASNALITNAPVGIKVSILQGSANGAVVFAETHAVTTNANGLATLQIGNGTNLSGSIATIVWTAGPFFIKTETDPTGGANYTIAATTQLLSVPYALYSATSGSSTPGPQGIQGIQGPIGPQGPQGPAGAGGLAGSDGVSVNCLECHNHNPATATALSKKLDAAAKEYEFSKHSEEAALPISEGGTTGCAPCHSSEGFHSVVDGNVVPTMVLGSNSKYTFNYNATAAATSGLTTMATKITCFTCHKGQASDSMAMYTTAPIQMCMYPVGSQTPKTINLTANGGKGNLCAKCHQPRPMQYSTTTSNGQSVDYAGLAANPSAVFFSAAVGNASPNKLIPAYRTHNHYGAVGGVFAGQAGVQFTGALSYNQSTHTNNASCPDCHMATPQGMAGGHSFWVRRVNEDASISQNFKGCNKSGCHTTMAATALNTTQATHVSLLNQLADKLRNPSGVEIMHKNTDLTTNIFAYMTTNGYDGYLDIYDPSTNPTGQIKNPVTTGYTAAQLATNNALSPLGDLLNVQFGAIINFQLCLREFSRGVHNPAYEQALLNNTLDALTANGF